MNIISRLQNKYFVYHTLGSLALIAIIYLILSHFWYPNIFFELAGGVDGFKILFAVDVVLGPALTFIFFAGKKSPPITDLLTIFAVQTICLLAGLFLIYDQRPLAIVFIEDHAYTVNNGSFLALNIEAPNLNHIPGPNPKAITIITPEADNDKKAFFRSQLKEGLLQVRTELYTPLKGNLDKLIKSGLSIKQLEEFAEAQGLEFINPEKLTSITDANARAFRLITGHRRSFIIISTQTGETINYAMFNFGQPNESKKSEPSIENKHKAAITDKHDL